MFFKGFWGEIRNWKDGTTILQKTHDASEHHVLEDFGGRGILILRNPYDAILSTHNFLYAGHHAKGPVQNYQRKGNEFKKSPILLNNLNSSRLGTICNYTIRQMDRYGNKLDCILQSTKSLRSSL